MTPPRRAKLVLLVLAVAIVGLGVRAWEPVCSFVVFEEVPCYRLSFGGVSTPPQPEDTRRGICVRNRWTHQRRFETFWWAHNGFLATKHEYDGEELIRTTHWNADGSMHTEHWDEDGDLSIRGVPDQTAPSMPEWMKDDAKWQAALDAQE